MIEVDITNLDFFTRMADKFPAIARSFADKAILQTITEIARNTQPLVPVDTANLKNSFIPMFQPFVGYYGTTVKYANAVSSLYSAGTPYKNPSKNKNAVAGFLQVGVGLSKSKIDAIWANVCDDLIVNIKQV